MNMGVCEVSCCRSSQDPRRIYHRFPNDSARLKEWLKVLGKKSSDLKTKPVVCSRHFRFKDYYSGGKRLLPSATPVLRLSNSPKKDKPVFKVRQSEPNRPNQVNKLSPTRFRKSVPNLTTNQSKKVKLSPQLLKKNSKLKVALDTSRSRRLVKTDLNPKNAKHQNEKILNADSSKAVVRKNLKHNQVSWKPASKLGRRSPFNVNKSSLTRSRYGLLCKNNNKLPLKRNDGRKPSAGTSARKGSSISKVKRCATILSGQSTDQPPSKLKENGNVVKLKNSIGSDGIITSKSPSDSSVNENKNKSLEQVSTSDKTNIDACEIESKNRRPIIKDKDSKTPLDSTINEKKIELLEQVSTSAETNIDVCELESKNRRLIIRDKDSKSPLDSTINEKKQKSLKQVSKSARTNVVACELESKNRRSIIRDKDSNPPLDGTLNEKKKKSSKQLSTSAKTNTVACDLESKNRRLIIKEKDLKSPLASTINEKEKKSLKQVNISAKTNIVACELEPKNRRSIKKRKRLLSEEGDNCDETFKSKPKIQKYKNSSGVPKKERKQTQTNLCNTGSKNLSGIEKTILEMQNKIQVLEKKAILDEKRIETFKKALITQRNTDLQILMDEKENELLLRMDLLYLDYDPQRICRLCLQLVDKKENLTPLFWPLKNQALLSLIKQATNVEVELEDGMPTGICGECLEDIRRVDWLKRRTQKSNSLIKKFVNMKKSSTQNNVEIPQMANNWKLRANDISSEEDITEVFKIEDVFSLENSPISFENIPIKQEHETDEDSKLNNGLNTTYSIVFKKPQISRTCGNCSKSFENPWITMIHFKYCSKRFQCSECNKCFLNAALLRRHKQTMYSCFCSENLRYCSDCNIGFRWKWQLVFHVLRHSTQMCVLCGDTIHSKEHLKRHFQEAHANY